MSTNDFISVFLSIELQSYGLYLLSTIYRNSELSTTGGLIYFLLGGLSSCFILLGTSLLYANSGTTNMDSLYVRASARIFVKLIYKIHPSREGCRVRSLAWNRVYNLLIRKDRVTIACYVKWGYEGISSWYPKLIKSTKVTPQENLLTQELPLADSDLSNASFFFQKTDTGYKELDSRQSRSNLSMITCEEVYLLPRNYLTELGTGNKSTTKGSKYEGSSNKGVNTSVTKVIGEIPSSKERCRWEVRGSIVVNKMTKGSKSRQTSCRAYSTSSRSSNTLQPLRTGDSDEQNLAFEQIARLWKSNYNQPTKIHKNLKHILNAKELWYASYIKVRTSKGSNTPGTDKMTLDGTNMEKIDALRESVMKRQFEWTPIKRVLIPKTNGKSRPLGIPSLNDRVVQEVLRTILEPIFDPTFSGRSHGFRPGRSCHTALKYVNTHFRNVTWYIEGDISKYFDSVNHNKLIHLIKRKVRDNLILSLIERGLKADIMYKDEQIESLSGTPQGGILSPLLANIYLNELDNYIKKITAEYLGPNREKRINPEYRRLMTKSLRSYDPKKVRKLRISRTMPKDPDFGYVRYVRYADDFLIGVSGSHRVAFEIRERIKTFLKENLALELNEEKTKITHIARGIRFLGYIIRRKYSMIEQRTWGKVTKRKLVMITLSGDAKKMIANLAKRNFCDKSGTPKPNFSLLTLPQSETNARINSVIRGISNWWGIAGDRRKIVHRISYILRFSIAKVYAAKFKLKTTAQVFKKGGVDISKPLSSKKKAVVGVTDAWVDKWTQISDVDDGQKNKKSQKERKIPAILYCHYWNIPKTKDNKIAEDWVPEFVKEMISENGIALLADRMKNGKLKSQEKNPLAILGWRISKGIRALGEPCTICGATEDVEMHHVKSLKDMKPIKHILEDKERAIRRKQIPLCKTHHLMAHNYNWKNPAISIKKLLSQI